MKKVFFVLLLFGASLSTIAQFTSAQLQAAGLTCALCSRSINKSLEKLSFIKSVEPDIKSSSFAIVFKPGSVVNIDEIKTAVEDAGFSVAGLKLTGVFNNVKIENNAHVSIDGSFFHFLKANTQVLQGEKTISIVDKDFVNLKEFKKLSNLSKLSCVQTGKAASCCLKEGIKENARVYHVII